MTSTPIGESATVSHDRDYLRWHSYWSRRQWIGTAIGLALPTFLSNAQSPAATYLVHSVVASGSRAAVWRPIPDPTRPGRFLESASSVGVVRGIPAANRGTRTATWTATSLTAGYYKVTIHYFCHIGNATRVQVQKRGTRDAGWVTWKTTLNQQLGYGVTEASSRFVRTSRNVTPFASSRAASYFKVENTTNNVPNTGTLSIRLTDAGCPGGLMVADIVVLEYQGT